MATPPILPNAPQAYERSWADRLTRILALYFQQLDSPQQLKGATLNLDINTLPTEADVASLRSGDVYRDTTADNALKVKT